MNKIQIANIREKAMRHGGIYDTRTWRYIIAVDGSLSRCPLSEIDLSIPTNEDMSWDHDLPWERVKGT